MRVGFIVEGVHDRDNILSVIPTAKVVHEFGRKHNVIVTIVELPEKKFTWKERNSFK